MQIKTLSIVLLILACVFTVRAQSPAEIKAVQEMKAALKFQEVNAGTTVLTLANQTTQSVLRLLGG